jgi:large subunit ribosomal protein L4
MQIDIVNIEGKKVGQVDLADAVFGTKVKEYLLWEVVKAQQAAKRAGTHSTKTRANVRGGGKKPYKQKGTGNARQGSSRAPNFVGGGKVFGPHPRSYEYTVPKKVRRAALACALSLRAKEKKLVVVDTLSFDAPKTKKMAGILKALGLDKALVVDAKANAHLFKSVRNLARAKVLAPEGLNVYDILNHPGLVIAAGAIKQVEQRVLPVESAAAAAA